MTSDQILFALATASLAMGLWLLLPRPSSKGRSWGAGLCAAGLMLLVLVALFGLRVNLGAATEKSSSESTSETAAAAPWISLESSAPALGVWSAELVFFVLAGTTLISAIGAITMKNPVHCAIWFALTLMGTAGLMLFQGAQFLGVATIVVYAGAILVTFLFVLMLAQPRGQAYYDRVSWEGLLSACVGAVLVGILTLTISRADLSPAAPGQVASQQADARRQGVLAQEHVARLGSQLFSRHLISVEVAGTLLLVALVGAVAIVTQSRSPSRKEAGRG